MAHTEEVTITKDTNNPLICHPDREFEAFKSKGDEVKFVFNEEPNASITFDDDSPFAERVVPANINLKLRAKAREGHYTYTIGWADSGTGAGSGAGSGDVGH